MSGKKVIQILCIFCLISIVSAQQRVSGTVFLDLNKNGVKDSDETGIENVLVSNGRDVIKTNQNGSWLLPLTGDSLFFVIKPANYATTLNENMIPHATMNDGAPNCYSTITFDSTSYRITFKAARRPSEYQMNIYFPDDLTRSALDTTEVLVNVFAGSERSTVEMSLDRRADWKKLKQVVTLDPEVLRMHRLSSVLEEKYQGQTLEEIFGWKMDFPSKSRHMWRGTLPADLSAGTHCITVRPIL